MSSTKEAATAVVLTQSQAAEKEAEFQSAWNNREAARKAAGRPASPDDYFLHAAIWEGVFGASAVTIVPDPVSV